MTGNGAFVYLVVGFAAIGALLFGLDQGNWGGAIEKDGFTQVFCVDNGGLPDACRDAAKHPHWYTNFLSWGSSLLQLGAAVGALLVSPIITGRCGRRQAMMIGSLVFTCGIPVTMFVRQTTVFLLARFVLGIGTGIVTYALPMFISEVAPPRVRGALGSLFQLLTMSGVWLASMIEASPSVGYQFAFALPMFPAVIVAVGIMCFPISPRFAMIKGQRQGSPERGIEEARNSLVKLRGNEAEAEEELEEIQSAIAMEGLEAPWSTLWRDPSIRKRVLIANLLQWGQQFTGVNAILSYGPSIFNSAGVPLSPFVASAISNAFGVAFTILMILLIDTMGRRSLLLVSTAGSFIFILAGGIVALMLEHGGGAALGWALVVCVCGYMASFSMGWGAIAWVYPSEIFPMDVKEKALSTSVCSQWTANFVIAYMVPQQMEFMKASGTFFFFAACLALAFICLCKFVPETKGIALEDMDKIFGPRLQEDSKVKSSDIDVRELQV